MIPFITFEGIEGCGKTTQIALAGQFLERRGVPCLVTAEPGGTPLGKAIRRIVLHDRKLDLSFASELMLFCADRAEHVRQVIEPALQKGIWVLCDRFGDATAAYQGYGRGLDLDLIFRLNRFASAERKPDLTFLFDIPVETGLRRARSKTASFTGRREGDRIEAEDLDFHRRVRDGYLLLAAREPERFRIIDGRKEMDKIHAEVCAHLELLR